MNRKIFLSNVPSTIFHHKHLSKKSLWKVKKKKKKKILTVSKKIPLLLQGFLTGLHPIYPPWYLEILLGKPCRYLRHEGLASAILDQLNIVSALWISKRRIYDLQVPHMLSLRALTYKEFMHWSELDGTIELCHVFNRFISYLNYDFILQSGYKTIRILHTSKFIHYFNTHIKINLCMFKSLHGPYNFNWWL